MVRLTGRQATNYQGVQASSPPDFSVHNRPPTPTDWQNFYLGDLWEVSNTNIPQDQFVYILVSLRNNIANWVRFAGGNGNLTSLTSNTGGTVFGDALQNINTVGDGTTITGVGNPGTNTITFSVIGGRAAQSFVSSVVATPTVTGGTATPILGVINVQSSHNLNVSAGLPNTPAANDIIYWTTNVSTWGDLANITAGNFAIQAFTGDITITANNAVGNLNLPLTTSAGNAGVITQGGSGFANRVFHTRGVENTFSGFLSGNNTFTIGSAQVSSAYGYLTLNSITTGSANNMFGDRAGALVTTGFSNTGVGNSALNALTTGNENIAIGNFALSSLTTGEDNTAVGLSSLPFLLTGVRNICVGHQSGNSYIGAERDNVVIGVTGGRSGENGNIRIQTAFDTGDNNIFIGQEDVGDNYTVGVGKNNIGIGANCFIALTTGANNVCHGLTTLNKLTTGSSNTAIGVQSLTAITTGSFNVSIGQASGSNYTTSESSNILIGNLGTVSESNTIRIGGATGSGAGQQNRFFAYGIRGITTGINDAIAVLIDSAGQLGTVSSSMRYKDNIQDMFHHSIDIYNLRPVIFTYKGQDKISYGLIAEEVEDVMPNLVVYNDKKEPETVKYLDLIPMLLNEIQKLNTRIDYLEKGMKYAKFNL